VSADWSDLQDVRRTYSHADGIRTESGDLLTVFNIGGNKYRLIARIRYDYELINVRAVLTHEEYDESRWKE
jgi:mRNA interferase HigB